MRDCYWTGGHSDFCLYREHCPIDILNALALLQLANVPYSRIKPRSDIASTDEPLLDYAGDEADAFAHSSEHNALRDGARLCQLVYLPDGQRWKKLRLEGWGLRNSSSQAGRQADVQRGRQQGKPDSLMQDALQ